MKKTLPLALLLLSLIPSLIQGKEFEVRILKDADDLPEKFCTMGKKGDFCILDGQYLVLLGGTPRPIDYPLLNFPRSNAMGSIIGFAPAGENVVSDLSIGSPVLKFEERRHYITYSSLKPMKEGSQEKALTFMASALYEGKGGEKALIQTTYDILYQEGRIHISTTIKNTGTKELEGLDFSLYFWPYSRYYSSPFDRKHHPGWNFRLYQKKGHFLGWMDLNPLPPSDEEDEPHPGHLSPGKEYRLNYILFVDSRSEEILQKIYSFLGVKLEKADLHFRDHEGQWMEVLVQDALSSAVFYRSFLQNTSSLIISLPQGAYLVRANFFPAVCEEFLLVKEGAKNTCLLQRPPLETLKIRIENSHGEFVPGKVTFIGLDPTKTPYFQPENPTESGRKWETFKNSCFPSEEGLELELAVGTYLVSASRGPEFTLDQKVVEVLKGKKLNLVFHIDKVVDTKGLISIDPHMHTLFSDGNVGVSERIKSVVAEAVDVAVATDHNTITDYRPILEMLELEDYLSVIPGNEVTRDGLIHYNTYPLPCREEEERNGAISPLGDEVSALFAASRKKDPALLLQVNHPRSGDLGYFNNYRLDRESAAFARTHFDTSFDILEVMNGPFFTSSNEAAIEDWFHLLNRGYYFPIVGSSDSHSIDKEEPGYSRTYVYYEGGKGDKLDFASLGEALKKGRSFTSNGPLVYFNVNNSFTCGDLAKSPNGEVNVSIQVHSAPWISVDEVRLVINGKRKIVFPVSQKQERILKFSEEIGLRLAQDAFIAVEVLGQRSLFPVLQRRAKGGMLEKATLPYALTNPVFIDIDGNGRFNPPLPEKIHLTSSPPKTKIVRERY